MRLLLREIELARVGLALSIALPRPSSFSVSIELARETARGPSSIRFEECDGARPSRGLRFRRCG